MIRKCLLILIPILMCIGLVLIFTKSRYVVSPKQQVPRSNIIQTIYHPNGDVDEAATSRAIELHIKEQFDRERLRQDVQRAGNRIVTPLNGSSQW